MTDPVFQIFGAPPNGESLALFPQTGVSPSNSGQTQSTILSFSNVYQDAAQLLKSVQNAQNALANLGEQLSGNDDVQQPAGHGSEGEHEQSVIGQLLGLVEKSLHHQGLDTEIVGEGAQSNLTLPEFDDVAPIIQNDDVLSPIPVAQSGVNNPQGNPGHHETLHALIESIAGSYATAADPSSPISRVNSGPSHQSTLPLLPQPSTHAPLAQQTYLGLNPQQGVTAPERDTTHIIHSLEKLGLVNDPKADRVIPQAGSQTAQRIVPFDAPVDKLPPFSGPVDPNLQKNQSPITPASVVGPSQPAVPNPLIVNGGLVPINGEGTQGPTGAEGEIRLGSTSIKSVQISQGETGNAGNETYSGQHPNGGLASSPESHHGNSSNMNQGQGQHALRASAFEERLQAYQATPPQRLQIDVQLSETARVQVDVAVQQRQVYAGLLMDQPILRNLALQHVPQLEEQLNQNGMELQEFDAQVDQQEKSQREVFEDVAHAFPFGPEQDEDPVDLVKTDPNMATDQGRGLHFVA